MMDEFPQGTNREPVSTEPAGDVTRRGFLHQGLTVLAGVSAATAAASPLLHLNTDDIPSLEEFFQKHYKEMSPADMADVLERIRAEVEARYDVRPEIRDIKPNDGVEFVYALHLGRCIGCRRCVHACVAENNQSRSPEIQ